MAAADYHCWITKWQMFGDPSYGFLHQVRCEPDFVTWTWGTHPVNSIQISTGSSVHQQDVPSHYVFPRRGLGPVYPDLPPAQTWNVNRLVVHNHDSALWVLVELVLNFSHADPRKWEAEEKWTTSPSLDGSLKVHIKNSTT